MPYRVAHVESEKKAAEPGIVRDMVRQFADKHAFLRELVQNGLDAGATRIDVRIDRDDSGVVRTSVTDDGSGMSRAIIEGPLLTLFSSSKEGDSSKIGKYGIGFVSVFALEPDHVEVRTRAVDDVSWLLRLFGDHTWELEEPRDESKRGTTVTLVQKMPLDAFVAHVEASLTALGKWCRHARIPIELVALDAGDPAATRTVAIQQPLGVPGLVHATWQGSGERIVVGVGGSEPVTYGYYNRGLTLFEGRRAEGALGGVRVAIDSPKLSHTLSRDDIVRDAELKRLVRKAEELVRGPLAEALFGRIAETAASATKPDELLPLVEAGSLAVFRDFSSRLVVPLVDPVGPALTMDLDTLVDASKGEILVAHESTLLTRALARRSRPVVRWGTLAPLLRRFVSGVNVSDATVTVAYSGRIAERHPEDDALEAAVLAVLLAIDKDAARVRLATFEGAVAAQAFRVVARGGEESVVDPSVTAKRAWGTQATAFLNVDDAAVRLARRRARTEPVVAAHLLCRALLVAEGPLPAKLVDRLLEAALE